MRSWRRLSQTWVLILGAACGSSGSDGNAENCPVGQIRCGALCVTSESDPDHCGGCEKRCDEGSRCDAGVCVETCRDHEERCDEGCIDTLQDPRNCGACGAACAAGEICVDGTCGSECPQGRRRCGERCVELDSDSAHCGSCERPCSEGEICQDGSCVADCAEGELLCDGRCVDTRVDGEHCGGCNQPCPPGRICSPEGCVCAGALEACGEFCTDTQVDATNCGGCGIDCTAGANISRTSCDAGVCHSVCSDGWGDCDRDPLNGCEKSLVDDDSHCGACDNDCGTKPNVAQSTCADGVCHVLACEPGWDDCDGEGSNGCEASLSDLATCGACDFDCRNLPNVSGESACSPEGCVFTCADGWSDCDGNPINGCEAFLDDDPLHCGACNHGCAKTDQCREGLCVDTLIANWPLPPDQPSDELYVVDAESGVVTDTRTGLQWQRELAAMEYLWEEAEGYCRSLRTGGFDDWRVPSAVELMTLLHLGQQPTIAASAFPDTPEKVFVSSTVSTFVPDQFMGVNFQQGAIGSYYRNPPLPGVVLPYPVRCVRAGFASEGERFTATSETVSDHKTRLMWQRNVVFSEAHTYDWDQAMQLCANLTLAGMSDWRLPSVKELFSLADLRRDSPAIDAELFPIGDGIPYTTFWSSSPVATLATSAWAVGFSSGASSFSTAKTTLRPVRCVRSLD